VRLETGLLEVVALLEDEHIPYMVIGGFANLFWGVPRTTQDIDMTLQAREENLPGFLKKISERFRVLPEDPGAFVKATRVLPIETSTQIRVDLIFAGLPYEEKAISRARSILIRDRPVRICSPEDLIVHKILSERPRDREDVEGIFRQQGPSLDFAYLDPIVSDLADVLGRSEMMGFYNAMRRSVLR